MITFRQLKESLQKKKKASIDDFLPASKGPVHTSKEIHDEMTKAGYHHLENMSKHDSDYDHYKHPKDGTLMIDKNGNYKRSPKFERGGGWLSDMD
jgi:hypothetical protein